MMIKKALIHDWFTVNAGAEKRVRSFLYFDPNIIIQHKEKIKPLIIHNDLQQELIEKGLENIKRFSWASYVRKIQEII